MAVIKDIETEVETAFITVLDTSSDIGAVTPRAWKDGSSARTLPAILVHCSPVGLSDVMNGTQTPTSIASYVVSDAGNTTYNGTYYDSGETYAGVPAYFKTTNSRWLYKYGTDKWALGDSKGGVLKEYNNTTATTPELGTWLVDDGIAPAPTVITGETLYTTQLYTATVELAVQTDSTKDKDQAVLKSYMGAIRDVLAYTDLHTQLTSASDITFIERGITYDAGAHTVDDDEINQISITLTCQVIK